LKQEIHKYPILPGNGIEKPVPEMCTERRFQYYHFPNRSMYKAGRYRRKTAKRIHQVHGFCG